jgi:hypothetical protein
MGDSQVCCMAGLIWPGRLVTGDRSTRERVSFCRTLAWLMNLLGLCNSACPLHQGALAHSHQGALLSHSRAHSAGSRNASFA